jgi:MFS family permease
LNRQTEQTENEAPVLPEGQNVQAARVIWKDPIFWFVIALGLGYGSVYNFLPISFPIFKEVFGATLDQMGRSQFLFFIAGLVFSFVGGPIIGFLGLKRSVIAASLLTGLALVLIGMAPGFNYVLASAVLLGLGIAALVILGSSIISRHFKENRQSVFFITGLSDAGGSMLGPAVLGWWYVHAAHIHLTWRSGSFIAAGVMALLLIWCTTVNSQSMSGESAEANPSSSGRGLKEAKEILANSTIYVVSLLGLLHGLAQAGMLSFVGQLYLSKLRIDAAQAAYFLSLGGAGMLGGRFALSWITAKWRPPELMVITCCAAGEAVFFLATILCPTYLAGICCYTMAEIFVSAIGPSLNSYLGGRYVTQAATAFSLFAGLSGIGSAVGPYIIGGVGERFGVEKGIFFGPLFGAVLCTGALIRYFQERATEPAPVASA